MFKRLLIITGLLFLLTAGVAYGGGDIKDLAGYTINGIQLWLPNDNDAGIHPRETSLGVLVGSDTTSTDAIFEVQGDSYFNGIVTSTKAYSTTYCINNSSPDCITAWPTGVQNWDFFDPITVKPSSTPSTPIGIFLSETSSSSVGALRVNGDFTALGTNTINGYVPYTGATTDVDLGTYDLTAHLGNFTTIQGQTSGTVDTNTQILFSPDRMQFNVGGITMLDFNEVLSGQDTITFGSTAVDTIFNNQTTYFNNSVGIGTGGVAGGRLEIGAGTLTVPPLKLNSGGPLTSPVAGAIEFTNDSYYGTITTGPTRKTFSFVEDDALAYLKLDQTTPQTVINGTPVFNVGLSAANQIISTLAIGTSPFNVTSNTVNTNLNADLLDGLHVGTSGSAVPNMSADNTWTGAQIFAHATPGVSITGTAPQLVLGQNSPAGATYTGTIKLLDGQTASYAQIDTVKLSNGAYTASMPDQGTNATKIVTTQTPGGNSHVAYWQTAGGATDVTGNKAFTYNGSGTVTIGSAGTQGKLALGDRGSPIQNSITLTTPTSVTASYTRTLLSPLPAATTLMSITSTGTEATGAAATGGSLTFGAGHNLILDSVTGTRIGTATNQKLGFYNATAIVQPGATTDLGVVLSNLGLRAAGTAYPITTSGAVTLGSLTATRIPFAGTAGLLSDDADLTFTGGDTLTATKIGAYSAVGDITFVGSGVGLPYGSAYGNGIAWAQASAAQNTWYDISDTDMTDGQLNNVTHDGSGLLTVATAGVYRITYSVTDEVSTVNKHIETGVSVSGTVANDCQARAEADFANQEFNMGSTCLLSLAANATLQASIRTVDTGTPNLTVYDVNITATQVGG